MVRFTQLNISKERRRWTTLDWVCNGSTYRGLEPYEVAAGFHLLELPVWCLEEALFQNSEHGPLYGCY